MRSLLLAALLGLAAPVLAQDAKPAEAPAAAPAAKPLDPAWTVAGSNEADMARIRAALQGMQEHNPFLGGRTGSDPLVEEPAHRFARHEEETGPLIRSVGPSAAPIGRDNNDGLADRGRRREQGFNVRINDQLKNIGIDAGRVDVGLGGKKIVLGIKF